MKYWRIVVAFFVGIGEELGRVVATIVDDLCVSLGFNLHGAH